MPKTPLSNFAVRYLTNGSWHKSGMELASSKVVKHGEKTTLKHPIYGNHSESHPGNQSITNAEITSLVRKLTAIKRVYPKYWIWWTITFGGCVLQRSWVMVRSWLSISHREPLFCSDLSLFFSECINYGRVRFFCGLCHATNELQLLCSPWQAPRFRRRRQSHAPNLPVMCRHLVSNRCWWLFFQQPDPFSQPGRMKAFNLNLSNRATAATMVNTSKLK